MTADLVAWLTQRPGVLTGVCTPGRLVDMMKTAETAEQREARRMARVAKREAQQTQDEAAIAAVLGVGWQIIRINTRYILSPLRTASTPVTVMNWPTFESPSLDDAVAQALNAREAS